MTRHDKQILALQAEIRAQGLLLRQADRMVSDLLTQIKYLEHILGCTCLSCSAEKREPICRQVEEMHSQAKDFIGKLQDWKEK